MKRAQLAVVIACVLVAGCDWLRGKGDVEVEGVLIAQAYGNVMPDEAPTVTLKAGERADAVALPDSKAVRLAIGREVSYGRAKALIKRVEAEGKRPIILVGERYKLRAIELNDAISSPKNAIRLVVTPEGKACVAPPDNPESKCVFQKHSSHVSTAYVREFVREAIGGYGLTEVRVFVRPSVEWADVIRAVDGARTCCDVGDMHVVPKVRLADWDDA